MKIILGQIKMQTYLNQLHPIPVIRAIIENQQKQVLLLRRANTKFGYGSWCLPGGKIDVGQTVENALKIELYEELSVKLDRHNFLFYQNSLPLDDEGLHCINLYFLCEVSGSILINSESSEYAWVGETNLNLYNIVFNNKDALIKHFTI